LFFLTVSSGFQVRFAKQVACVAAGPDGCHSLEKGNSMRMSQAFGVPRSTDLIDD
jgi:hypothetical protein